MGEEVEKAPLLPVANHDPTDHNVAPKKSRNYATSLPCDPHRWMHRYFMLFLMCTLSFGMYCVWVVWSSLIICLYTPGNVVYCPKLNFQEVCGHEVIFHQKDSIL